LTVLVVAGCMMITAGNAMAAEDGPKFKLGVGTYSLLINHDSFSSGGYSYGEGDDRFYGGALTGTACFTKHLAVRGAFYATEHYDYSWLDAKGMDLQLLVGTNFYNGWNLFGGVGYYSETWKVDAGTYYGVTLTGEKDFSGAEATIGVGYSWSKIALDYVLNFRDTSDYEDIIGVNYAVSGGLNISYIF